MTRMLEYFTTLVAADEGLPLTEAALALAQDAYPDLDIQGTLAEIDALVLRLKRRLPDEADIVQKLQMLNRFFYRELGLAGNLNDYYDPDNSFLHVVVRKRRGIPISLAVLYMEMGQQIGLNVHGIAFPGHFLLRVTTTAGEVMLDPLTGEALSEAQMVEMLEPYVATSVSRSGDSISNALRALLAPSLPREILARMLRNLKAIYQQTERWQRLLAVQQRMVILLPEQIEERRDRGLAYAKLDFVRAALDDLQLYLDTCPEAEDAAAIETQLADLRQRASHSGR
ncbi:SirB1 family protein [Burkholderia sp. L27(2015)]|uniref:SirB1 family protein n=1 Tax=Burkholderia sp. L27(2015) TaxID=1641858 RepID=UPI00131C35F5|nr:tetratricopeptide repeat protein [Burkholderia sp. L27(2015)]